MYSDCYLKEDVNEVTKYKEQLVQACVRAIQMAETTDFMYKSEILNDINNNIKTLELYHNKKNKRDEHNTINSLNRGIRI